MNKLEVKSCLKKIKSLSLVFLVGVDMFTKLRGYMLFPGEENWTLSVCKCSACGSTASAACGHRLRRRPGGQSQDPGDVSGSGFAKLITNADKRNVQACRKTL